MNIKKGLVKMVLLFVIILVVFSSCNWGPNFEEVANVKARSTNRNITLSWKNPSQEDFEGLRIIITRIKGDGERENVDVIDLNRNQESLSLSDYLANGQRGFYSFLIKIKNSRRTFKTLPSSYNYAWSVA